jgi:signal transduction histidine kinase
MLTHDVAQPISSIASLAELLSRRLGRAGRRHPPRAGDQDRQEHPAADQDDERPAAAVPAGHRLGHRAANAGAGAGGRRPRWPPRCAADVEIEIDEDLAALADRQHLWHVVHNLLGNALAYGEPPVRIRAARAADVVELVVQDSGPGIPEELVPQLFDRFMRGAGLGLFIVRHLVEANGGSVRYERAEPRGARLVVTFESAL